MSFAKFLYSNQRIIESQISYDNFIDESFNSMYDIIKTSKTGNVSFYYFNINDTMYRIYIERINDDITIGFEFKKNENEWEMFGTRNRLQTDETIKIFGTIYNIIKQNKFNALYVCSNEEKKYNLYNKMMIKLSKEYNDYSLNTDGKCIVLKLNNSTFINMFKYKGAK